MQLLWEAVGWIGSATLLGIHLGLSMGWMKIGLTFHVANLLGACIVLAGGTLARSWPSLITCIGWLLVSSAALQLYARRRKVSLRGSASASPPDDF